MFGEPVESDEITKGVDNINNATLDNIEEVFQSEFLNAQAKSLDAEPLSKAYKARMIQLTTIVSIANVSKGEYLMSFYYEEIYQVTKKTKDSVTLKNINTEETETFTEQELVDNFQKTTMEATQPEQEVEINQFDVEDSIESKDTINDLIKNGQDALDKSKEQAKTSDKKSRLKKLGDNSKLC